MHSSRGMTLSAVCFLELTVCRKATDKACLWKNKIWEKKKDPVLWGLYSHTYLSGREDSVPGPFPLVMKGRTAFTPCGDGCTRTQTTCQRLFSLLGPDTCRMQCEQRRLCSADGVRNSRPSWQGTRGDMRGHALSSCRRQPGRSDECWPSGDFHLLTKSWDPNPWNGVTHI